MATIWNTVFKTLPANNQVVWIRVIAVYGELALAEYNANKEEFTVVLTGITIPVFYVSRWKPQ